MAIELPFLTKPRFAVEACNGCGLCCSLELCEGAEMLFPGVPAPCPALIYENGRTFCGIVKAPERFIPPNVPQNASKELARLFGAALGIGAGCSMPDEKD